MILYEMFAQVEDRLQREDELGNRVWRHQVSFKSPPDCTSMELSLKSSSGVAGGAGGCDSFSAVVPPRLGEDVGQEADLCQQIQEENRTIVEQVALLLLLNKMSQTQPILSIQPVQ